MSVLFKINKLGPITNSSMEMKPFMVLSGESSMGKSYAAFLVYYLQRVFDPFVRGEERLIKFVDERIGTSALLFDKDEGSLFKFNIEDLCDYLQRDVVTYLRYLTGYSDTEIDVDFIFKTEIRDFEVTYKKDIVSNELGSKDRIYLRVNEDYPFSLYPWELQADISTSISFYISDHILNNMPTRRSFIFPPSRGGFVSASFSSLKAVTTNSGMYQDFVDGMELILQPQSEPFSSEGIILYHIINILGGTIINEKGNLFYDFHGRKIPVTAAASSIKELAPLFLLLIKYAPRDVSVLFEEPESHLHPELHIKIASLITLLVNKGANFQVTTHSDYFLTQINNLIKLYYLQSKLDEKSYEEFCAQNGFDKDLVLNPEKVGAYFFKRREDGSVEIVTQEIAEGIPFDTFSQVINQNMKASLNLDNRMNDIKYEE